MPQLILVVDDEAHIRTAVVRALNLIGYQAEAAASGLDALRLLIGAAYDLMILDMQMPELDGVEVMHRTRQVHPNLPIIVLTGHATLDSAIAAVKLGAVDYLLKPAGIDEIARAVANGLQARSEEIRQQQLLDLMGHTLDTLRRLPKGAAPSLPVMPAEDRFLRVGPLTLDCRKRLVFLTDAPPHTIELTEGEAAVLAALMQQADQVISCRQLTHVAWNYDLDEGEAQSLIRPYIFRLRRKLEADPSAPRLICTLRGRGYLFATQPPAAAAAFFE